MYKSLHEHMLSFLLDKYLGVKWLNMVVMFNFSTNCQTVLQSGCSFLSFHQECTKILFGPPPCQHWHGQCFHFSHWIRYAVMPHCDFNLYVILSTSDFESFHVLSFYPYVLLVKVSTKKYFLKKFNKVIFH